MQFKPLITVLAMSLTAGMAEAYEIWPVPQKIENRTGGFDLSRQLTLVVDDATDPLTVSRVREVLDGASLSYVEASSPSSSGGNILIGVDGSDGEASRYVVAERLPRDVFSLSCQNFDPHMVSVDASAIVIVGDTSGSAFYGLASLEQMLEQREGNMLPAVVIEDYAHACYRGVVEGFYGFPYSMESRLNLLRFMKRYKMNYYVYGPKADPYHAGNWRVNYPETVTEQQRHHGHVTASEIGEMARVAGECGVDFVWAIHPTLGSSSVNLSWVDDIMKKFTQLHSLGVRHFGVSVDDMSGHPQNQAQLPHLVQQAIDARWNTEQTVDADRVGNLLFVPTCYALNYNAHYSLTPVREIDPKVEVAFTGYDCFSNLRSSSFATMASLIGRDPIFWWNNPVNDDYDNWLYMHEMDSRWTIEQHGAVSHMRGFMLNPMNQGQVSKIAIFSGADYSWNPDSYDSPASWEAALRAIVGNDDVRVGALKDFIRVMSHYTPAGVSSPQGEELEALYTAFRQAYSAGNVPECDELREAMDAALRACAIIRSFKDSDNENLALFYIDILPWLEKVEEMCSIVSGSIKCICGSDEIDNWSQSAKLASRASSIHSRFIMTSLEGSGTSTYEVAKEVMPTPSGLDPFVDFLAGIIGSHSPRLPERDRSPKVITNIADPAPEAAFTASGAERSLSGLAGLEMLPGEYVGVALGRIESVTVESVELPEGAVLEWSISGKDWTPAEFNAATPAAYLRVFVAATDTLTLVADEIRFTAETGAVDNAPVASTNMPVWQEYTVDKVVDGNPSTFFWSSREQQSGDYVMLDFGAVNPRGRITITFNKGDHPTGIAEVAVSADGSQWTSVAKFTETDIADNTFTCDAKGCEAQYVRLMLTSATGGNWFQLVGIDVESQGLALTSVALDNEGRGITVLDDRSLATHYKGQGAGSVTFRFVENIVVERVHIYHDSQFDETLPLPTVELLAGDEWIEAGTLGKDVTVVDVAAATEGRDSVGFVTAVRIAWTDRNIPDLYEIEAYGPEYVQSRPEPEPEPEPEPKPDPDPTFIGTVGADAGLSVAVERLAVGVVSPTPVVEATLTDIAGVVVARRTSPAGVMSLSLSAQSRGIVILTLRFADGAIRRVKLSVG